jgi:hypothetical protein
LIRLSDNNWMKLIIKLAAVVALPFYLGWVQATYFALICYSLVAGVAVVIGEQLDSGCPFETATDAVGQVFIYTGVGMVAASVACFLCLHFS